MFIYTKNAREQLVTAGVVVSLCLLLALSFTLARAGGYSLIFALLFATIATGVFKGIRLAYTSARLIFGTLTGLVPAGIINPFCYMDVSAAHGAYAPLAAGSLLATALFLFLFHCLGEHARLRNLKQDSWFVPVSTRALFWVILVVTLICAIGFLPTIPSFPHK